MRTAIVTLHQTQANTTFQRILTLFFTSCLLLLSLLSPAQDELMGLTSNGGPEGKGTAYSIKTDTKAFHVIEGFADWGSVPEDDLMKASDGNLYGVAPNGGTYGHGTLFKITNGGDMTILKHFNINAEGGYPKGSLVQATDGALYGTLTSGGNGGVIFKMTLDGKFSVLRTLTNSTDGGRPNGKLIQGTDGYLYGMNNSGGAAAGWGTIFKIKTDGSGYTVMKAFARTDGANPYSGLVQASDGALYGMTYGGGTTNDGVIFRITSTSPYTYNVLRHLNDPDGIYPTGDLIQAKDGYLYGMAPSGGTYGGTIFKLKTDGTSFKVLRNMSASTEGSRPKGSLIQLPDGSFYGTASSMNGGYGGMVFKMSASGTVTVLKKFTPATEGSAPIGGLVQGSDGALYGTTSTEGKNFGGTIFRITTSNSFSVLSHLNGASVGNAPEDNLVIGKDSACFGVAKTGGAYNQGTIYKICGGVTTVLKSFNRNTDGANPEGGLIRGTDNNLYGMTPVGGANGGGTIYKITPGGTFTVLRHLKSTTDGATPVGSLVQGPDGFLYGVTYSGGTGTGGTIFKLKTDGTSFAVLRHLVTATDGNYSQSGLVVKDGVLYGMTGNNPRFYKITTDGQFTVIKTLSNSADGNSPYGTMLVETDGAFYGTFSSGGTYGKGVIFKITTSGTLTKLRSLNGTTDGGTPKGGLVRGTDGAFYGTTSTGGTNGVGTIFKISGTTFSVLRSFDMATDGGTPLGGLIIAPKITLTATAQSVSTNEDVSKIITLTGSGATNLTFTIVTQPKNGTIASGTTASRSYKPKSNFYGMDSFAFTSNLGCLASAPAWVKITVTAMNDAPVLASIGNKTAVKDSTLKFTATATDVDAGQTKSFSLITAPTGGAISSGAFSWKPTATGTFTFKVRVTDNGSPTLYDEETITVTVTAPAAKTRSVTSAARSNLAETGNEPEAVLYPNPVASHFTVALNQEWNDVKLTIVDANGAMAYSRQYNGAMQQVQVDAGQLKPGAYIALLHAGNASKTLRFVKQ